MGYRGTQKGFFLPSMVFVVINLCLPLGCPVANHSCAQLETPDVSMDSYTEQLTAVRIHKQSDWLLLRFISRMIDCCWHNSCQRRKWWLTNDRAGSAVREITSALCEATRQSSLCLSQCLFTATLNHCRTDNTGKKKKKTSNKHILHYTQNSLSSAHT